MKNKTLLVIAAFVTVFLLTIGIGVVTNAVAKANQLPPVATVDTAAFLEREAAYQKLINEANQKIEQANQQISQLLAATSAPTAEPTSMYLFTPDQASEIAKHVTGVYPKTSPELVVFNGVTAYEVKFATGNIYVDANTGAIIYNGIQAANPYISSDKAIAIAKSYLGNNGFISINFGTFSGAKVYVVYFSNGQSVYISLYGKVLAVQMPTTSSGSDSGGSTQEPDHEVDDD
jgi:uncharacterized membrane protein YkoI